MIAYALVILQAFGAQAAFPEAEAEARIETVSAPFAEEQQVPELVLADQRGGIRLPSGIDVQLSIDTVSAVDGRIVLQTVTRIADGSPVVTAYAPEEGNPVELQQRPQKGWSMDTSAPNVTYDRQNGLSVTAGLPNVPVSITRSSGAKEADVSPSLQQLDLTQSATTPNGVVQTRGPKGMGGVELQGMDINIVHLTGNAFGSAIANSGNDRAIDTQTTLSIDLRNAGPDVLGSTMLRIEDVALAAVSSRF